MKLAIIVAAAENQVIGKDNQLIWHLPADLKHFKILTTGHTIIMGRKTFESIGRALPNRRNIVISTNAAFKAPGCELASSIEEALTLSGNEEKVFIIGGGSIYKALWDKVDQIYLTRVHTKIIGDTYIPELDTTLWSIDHEEYHNADEKNPYAYSFIDYRKKHG